MTFHEDLKVGQAKELEAIPLIVEHYKAHHQNVEVWLNPSTDLTGMRRGDIFDSMGVRWEVKYDRRFKETGNVYLEHAAISRSGADFVVYFLDGLEPVMVSKDLLMVLIEDNKNMEVGMRKYQIVNVGAGNEGTLLPLPDMLKLGRHLLKRIKKPRVYVKKQKRQFAYA